MFRCNFFIIAGYSAFTSFRAEPYVLIRDILQINFVSSKRLWPIQFLSTTLLTQAQKILLGGSFVKTQMLRRRIRTAELLFTTLFAQAQNILLKGSFVKAQTLRRRIRTAELLFTTLLAQAQKILLSGSSTKVQM
jgi:hypothetical protein